MKFMRRSHWPTIFAMTTLLCGAGIPASPTLLLGQDTDTTRAELANFDVFLDGHPEIARQLKQNPSLVNNEEFLESHQALQQYLLNHPNVREELQENPRVFMKGEARFERSGNDITGGELARFDNFLDSHPAIAQQLASNPSLVNNEDYLEKHPELQQFLQTHPGVRQELRENPQIFMQKEARFERSGNDITGGELARFDNFLDSHPAIAQQLASNPSLVNNEDYLEKHPELQQFLQTHPGVRQELRENPQLFMQKEARFERSGNDITTEELARFDNFLDSHPAIAKQLASNPSLVNNEEYVENHPELQQFLQTHSGVRQELRENPQLFMGKEARFDNRRPGHSSIVTKSKPKSITTKKPAGE